MSVLYKITKPQTPVEKKTRTVVDTIMVNRELLGRWQAPPFQRPVRENEKVRALAEEMKRDGGVWPGFITLGMLDGTCYLMDGQHRKAAFMLSGLDEGYTDVRTHYFTSMADMAEEFLRLNSQLVKMRPDDDLRAMECSIDGIRRVRTACPFVGYDYIRRSEKAPVVSMSVVVRAWRGSANDVPAQPTTSAKMVAAALTGEDYDQLIGFLNLAVAAFGRDQQYYRLWSGMNLIICMWLYRRLVLEQFREQALARSQSLSRDLFKKCLMSVSASCEYVDWLLGRKGDRDRAPCYARLKTIFAHRLNSELGHKVKLPQPTWAH